MLRPRRSRDEKDAEQETTDPDLARRVLSHTGTPEEKLEQLLAAHRQELDEQAARLEDAMTDLERRELLLRDMRASVERLLRLGASDLDEREKELQELGREFMEREARLSEAEAELKRRRSELGAVELRREAVEQRERALAVREEELAAVGDEPDPEPARAQPPATEADAQPAAVSLLFVPGTAYRLVQVERRRLEAGEELELDDEAYVVSRFGPSPLPGDRRTCAYLERRVLGSTASAGSS